MIVVLRPAITPSLAQGTMNTRSKLTACLLWFALAGTAPAADCNFISVDVDSPIVVDGGLADWENVPNARELKDPPNLGTVGPATISFDASEGLDGLRVTVAGVQFQPLADAAALNSEEKPDKTIPLQMEATVTDDVLRIELTTGHTTARGIDPGLVQGLSEWRRLDLSRYSEPHGQTWWPKTTYSVRGDFWFTAHWVMAESNGTRWKATNDSNRGSARFPAALQVVYEPDTDGNYLPIREVIELRFSKDLWDVVPGLRQKPSEYRDFLTRSVFVGGHQRRSAPASSPSPQGDRAG
jgi:hypothetical protein